MLCASITIMEEQEERKWEAIVWIQFGTRPRVHV